MRVIAEEQELRRELPVVVGNVGRICDLVHVGIVSHVGQAFLPDPVGQECPTYFVSRNHCTKSQMRPRQNDSRGTSQFRWDKLELV